jgi:hypothetical protein
MEDEKEETLMDAEARERKGKLIDAEARER